MALTPPTSLFLQQEQRSPRPLGPNLSFHRICEASQQERDYSSTRIQYEKKDKRSRRHADPDLGIDMKTNKTNANPPLGPRLPVPQREPEPPLNSQNRRQVSKSSNWGTFISSWAWQAGSRTQAKALGHVGLLWPGVLLPGW